MQLPFSINVVLALAVLGVSARDFPENMVSWQSSPLEARASTLSYMDLQDFSTAQLKMRNDGRAVFSL